MINKLAKGIHYYVFVKILHLAIILSFLMTLVPTWFFIESSYIGEYRGYFLEKYLIWKYGSLYNTEFISDAEKLNLFENVFIITASISCVLVSISFLTSIIYVFRNFSFKLYSIQRTNHLSDDIGFAATFCVLTLLYSYLLQIIFNELLYKILLSYLIQPAILYSMFKTKAYGYVVKKRPVPLKT